ncbi:bifunctional diguanylate cyclase/phosphodiesterase [Aquincola sp. J276]|uniref:putative bifunctional diguanylate cyclase/phosphodiesterase n=1 Tax=Aquincola sp. J276 TaxID=2898432 RepID=UPI002150E5A1|nr:GGDEF domain-containing protein [Aquincola sp. J276]MCR5868412.1 GGDEF domain-containing protein [Aquincola sp. J276]
MSDRVASVARPRFADRIGVRLVFAFAVLLMLLLGLAGFALNRMQNASAALERLAREQLRLVSLTGDIGREADASTRQLLHLLSDVPQNPHQVRMGIAAANARLRAAVETLEVLLPAGPRRESFEAVRARMTEYLRASRDTLDFYEAGDLASARTTLALDTQDTLALLADARDGFNRAEQRAAAAEARQTQQRLRRDRMVVLLLCLAALAAGAAFALRVTQGIARPLQRAEAAAGRIARGDYRGRVEVSTQDEVGRVAAALNTLAEAVSERELRIHRLVNTDGLTGLAQRPRFVAEGQRVLAAADASRGQAALLCFDIDRLKTINGILGFDAGDAVIRDAAERLRAVIGDEGRLARVAGGTFAALVPTADTASARDMALAMKREVEHQVRWEGESLDLSITTGVAMFPAHGVAVEQLLRHAEQALFEAKRLRVGCAVYAPSLEASRQSQLSLLSALTEAIEQGQLHQYLQPKLSPAGVLSGAEALVRWRHPERGWVPPGEFVPFAERTGRIGQVTDWMMREAVRTLARWQQDQQALTIAVNISTHDLQDLSLPQRVSRLLAEHGVQPWRLQLELTETGLMDSGQDPITVLHALADTGVGLAIDDFGTGHSSLAYLQRLPMHELKIDRSFVTEVHADARRCELLHSIVQLGHGLGLKVTGEGVETAAELQVLRQAGCDLVQGYHTGRPMDLAAFEAWRLQRLQPLPGLCEAG